MAVKGFMVFWNVVDEEKQQEWFGNERKEIESPRNDDAEAYRWSLKRYST
jgi:hypothetical protein